MSCPTFYPLHRFLWITVLLFSIFSNSQAQQKKNDPIQAAIMAKGRVQKDKILLRWAANDPIAWSWLNKNGVMVERFTILKGDKINPEPTLIRLTKTPLKAKPEAQWKSIVEKNDDAAVIAQGLFGENFEVAPEEGKLGKIITQTDQLNQRFTFSLMAADRNFEAALMAGWGWVDSTIKPDEKYLYRIYSAAPNSRFKIDTALLYLGAGDIETLPQPKDLYGVFGNKTVLLSWNYKILKDEYTTYFVEKSTDSIHFSKLSNLPVANLVEKENGTPLRMYYTDSLEENDKPYFYRIAGISAFGEVGPYSPSINGRGAALLQYVPNITEANLINDSTAVLDWEFPVMANTLIEKFEITQSANTQEESFQTIITNIAPTDRKITIQKLLPTNYFKVVAVDKHNHKRYSFPFLVQPVDSVPPAVPTGLMGSVDTAGNVLVEWQPNNEKDFLGYTILKNNNPDEEGTVLNATAWKKNQFKEKINLKTLNGTVYYAVIALDQRMNQSKPSTWLALSKPDKIPPPTPLFDSYTIAQTGSVNLVWTNSPATDLSATRLYKTYPPDSIWTLVRSFTDTTQHFTDDSVVLGKKIAYSLMAVDKSNNQSSFSPPLILMVDVLKKIPPVQGFTAQWSPDKNSIQLGWKDDFKDVVEYTLYKASDKQVFSVWKITLGSVKQAEDTEVKPDKPYQYGIRASFKNGQMSEWKALQVN